MSSELKPIKQGTIFGRLTVIRQQTIKTRPNGKHNFMYLCNCMCGVQKIIDKQSLISGDTKSCGCKRIENASKARRLPKGLAAAKTTFDTTKRNAKRRGISWSISFKQFYILSQQTCHYCGEPPSQITKRQYNGEFKHNGLDRLDSTKGYTTQNVVSCCKYCNYAKNTLSKSDFLQHVKKIFEHNFK